MLLTVLRRAAGCCAAVALAAATTLGAVPARADPRVTTSSPASGATVRSLPAEVTLTFDQPVAPHPLTVVVRGPDRIRVDVGDATVQGSTVTQRTSGAGTPGRYLLAYRVAAADGHAIIGEQTFTIGPGGATSADGTDGVDSAAGTRSQEPGAGLWARSAGSATIVVVLGTGLVVAARRRTRTA